MSGIVLSSLIITMPPIFMFSRSLSLWTKCSRMFLCWTWGDCWLVEPFKLTKHTQYLVTFEYDCGELFFLKSAIPDIVAIFCALEFWTTYWRAFVLFDFDFCLFGNASDYYAPSSMTWKYGWLQKCTAMQNHVTQAMVDHVWVYAEPFKFTTPTVTTFWVVELDVIGLNSHVRFRLTKRYCLVAFLSCS